MVSSWKLLIALLFGVVSASASFAQSVTTHTINRGETLASIAQKYGITEQALLELNPDAASLVYVGMQLNIPAQEQTAKTDVVEQEATSSTVISTTSNTSYYQTTDQDGKSYYVGIIGGYSINNYVGDDADDYDVRGGFHVGIVGGRMLNNVAFLESGLYVASKGYKINTHDDTGYWQDNGLNYEKDQSTKMRTYNLELPIFIGAQMGEYFFKVGPYFSYALSGERKITGEYTFHEDTHSSATDFLDDKTKISDMDNFNRFGIGLGASIGCRVEHFTMGFTYQRGLSKIFDNRKEYEQNILFSLGVIL